MGALIKRIVGGIIIAKLVAMVTGRNRKSEMLYDFSNERRPLARSGVVPRD